MSATSDTSLAVDGELDQATADRLAAAIRGAGPRDVVHIDLGRARTVQDAALPVLVDAVRSRGGARVLLEGLNAHHERILRYLGLDLHDGPAPSR